MIDYVEAVERGLDELDVLGLNGEAERLQHELGLGSLEHAPGRGERLRDDRALGRGALDATCDNIRHRDHRSSIVSHREIPMRGRGGGGRARTEA